MGCVRTVGVTPSPTLRILMILVMVWCPVSLRIAIPEFKHVANQFKLKYGEEFFKEALHNSCCVNKEVLEMSLAQAGPKSNACCQLMEKLSNCTDRDFVEDESFRLSPIPDRATEVRVWAAGRCLLS